MACMRRRNRDNKTRSKEKPTTQALRLVRVQKELDGESDGDEPVDSTAEHDTHVLYLHSIKRGVKVVHACEVVD
jgi:hypothetical protein